MSKKRKDQRFTVDEATEKQVFSLLDGATSAHLIELRAALDAEIQRVAAALDNTPTDMLSQSLALKSRRRGAARFEIDPDGRMVLVVSYGGEVQEPLSRREMKPAWNKRDEAKPKLKVAEPDEPPPKKKGFVKTSVAVSPTRVVTYEDDGDDLDLDDILDSFNDEDAKPSQSGEAEAEAEAGEVHEGYTPPSRSRLRRIPGQPVKKGRGNGKSLTAIMATDEAENGGDPS